jgi:hypothetical protein
VLVNRSLERRTERQPWRWRLQVLIASHRGYILPDTWAKETVAMAILGVLLDIDGFLSGRVLSAQGGDGIAPVVQEQYLDQSKKHIERPAWEDFELQFSLPLNRMVSSWVTDWWRQQAKPRTVRLTAYDSAMNVVRRREFQGAVITETTVSGLGTVSSEPLLLKLKLRPDLVQIIPPSGTVSPPTMPQPWLGRNLRLDLPGLESRGILKIDSFTVKQSFVESDRYAGEVVPGPLSFPNLTVTIDERLAATWQAWFDDFVVKGNNADTQEKTGRLSLLALLGGVLREGVRIDLFNVGIFRLTPSAWTNDDLPVVVAGLYCERMDFTVLINP